MPMHTTSVCKCQNSDVMHGDGPCYVIMRVQQPYVLDMHNSMNKNRSVIRNYGGRVVGTCDSADVVMVSNGTDTWRGNQAMCLLDFDKFSQATMWLQSQGDVRQDSFLFGVDIVLIPRSSFSPPDRLFCSITDVHSQQVGAFMQQFANPAAEGLSRLGGTSVNVVNSHQLVNERGMWNPQHLIVHFSSCPATYTGFLGSTEYKALEPLKTRFGYVDEAIFQLKPF